MNFSDKSFTQNTSIDIIYKICQLLDREALTEKEIKTLMQPFAAQYIDTERVDASFKFAKESEIIIFDEKEKKYRSALSSEKLESYDHFAYILLRDGVRDSNSSSYLIAKAVMNLHANSILNTINKQNESVYLPTYEIIQNSNPENVKTGLINTMERLGFFRFTKFDNAQNSRYYKPALYLPILRWIQFENRILIDEEIEISDFMNQLTEDVPVFKEAYKDYVFTPLMSLALSVLETMGVLHFDYEGDSPHVWRMDSITEPIFNGVAFSKVMRKK